MTQHARYPSPEAAADVPARSSGRLRRGVITAAAVTALVAGTAGTASAAPAITTAGGTTTANVVVETGIILTGLTPAFTLDGPVGSVQTAPISYTVITNNPTGYSVTVTPAAANLVGATPGNTATIPVTDLTVNGTALTGGTQTVETSGAPSATAGDGFTETYGITIPNVTPDTYTDTLDYLASTAL